MLARHVETVKPMITLRRTFPTLMPQSAPRSLPMYTVDAMTIGCGKDVSMPSACQLGESLLAR